MNCYILATADICQVLMEQLLGRNLDRNKHFINLKHYGYTTCIFLKSNIFSFQYGENTKGIITKLLPYHFFFFFVLSRAVKQTRVKEFIAFVSFCATVSLDINSKMASGTNVMVNCRIYCLSAPGLSEGSVSFCSLALFLFILKIVLSKYNSLTI